MCNTGLSDLTKDEVCFTTQYSVQLSGFQIDLSQTTLKILSSL